jgi:hypothetical protein
MSAVFFGIFVSVLATATVAHGRSDISCTLRSQGGTCDRIINLSTSAGPSVITTKFTSPGWLAGERVCLKAGNYPYARLQVFDIAGTATAPIEIINCGGQVVIGNTKDANADGKIDASRGIELNRARFVRLSGAGSLAHTYGIKLAGTIPGIPGLSFADLSTDMEAEFIEITRSGFSGIMAKTDPNCSDTNPTSFRGGFVMRNANFHDNYIHDLNGGEGFYVGYSFYRGNTLAACPNVKVYSHPLDNTRIFRNRLENTACEAIQIGCGENSQVYDNYIRGYGTDPFAQYQNSGIQIGGGTSGKFYNNFVSSTSATTPGGNAFMISNTKDTLVYGNTIVGGGMYVHKDAGKNWDGTSGLYTLRIANNTIVNSVPSASNRGIWNANATMKMEYRNNLVLLANPLASTGLTPEEHARMNSVFDGTTTNANREAGVVGLHISESDNHRGLISSEASTHFVNATAGDYRLKSTSPLVNAGGDVSALGVTVSMALNHTTKVVTQKPRFVGPRVDVGAFELPNRAPVVTYSPSSLTLVEGAVATFTVSAKDADGDPVTLSELLRPSFVVLTSSTASSRTYRVAPTTTTVSTQTTFQMKVRAIDDKGGRSDKVMNITVQNL